MNLTAHEEKLLVENMLDVGERLSLSNKIVLDLAKMEVGPDGALTSLIITARRYVLKHMAYHVGVRKMARERWGMVLLKAPKEK